MNISALLALVNLKKPEIVKSLKNGPDAKVKRNKVFFAAKPWDDLPAGEGAADFSRGRLARAQVVFPFENWMDGQELLEEIKERLTRILHTPKSDNSNHQQDNIVVSWEKDGEILLVKSNQYKRILLLISPSQSPARLSAFPLLISLAGGIAWGIIFYFSIAKGDFDPIALAISLGGGLIWGLIMALVMGLSFRFKKDNLKLTEKDGVRFERFEKKAGITGVSTNCKTGYAAGKLVLKQKAKIFIGEDKFIHLTLLYGKVSSRGIPFNSIKNYILQVNNGFAVLFADGKLLTFFECDNAKPFIDKLDEILGYNGGEFKYICESVYGAITEWDPLSLISGGEDASVFKDVSKNIAIDIHNAKTGGPNEIESILKEHFIGMPVDNWMPLANLINDKINERKFGSQSL